MYKALCTFQKIKAFQLPAHKGLRGGQELGSKPPKAAEVTACVGHWVWGVHPRPQGGNIQHRVPRKH